MDAHAYGNAGAAVTIRIWKAVIAMNRLNELCAFCPLYELDFRNNALRVWNTLENRLVFGIRDAVRRPSKVTFDTLHDEVWNDEKQCYQSMACHGQGSSGSS